jgi:hypothetical protein
MKKGSPSRLRRDVDLLVTASRTSLAGLRVVASRLVQMIGEALGEWRTVGAVIGAIGPSRSIRSIGKLPLASVELARADASELARLAWRTQGDALAFVRNGWLPREGSRDTRR